MLGMRASLFLDMKAVLDRTWLWCTLVGVNVIWCGCSSPTQPSTAPTLEAIEPAPAQLKSETTSAEASKENSEGDLRDAARDRIEILSEINNEEDRRAIHVAIEWLKHRSAEPLDVHVKLGRNGDRLLVTFIYVSRGANDEAYYYPGGDCTVTVSKSGEIAGVLDGV